MTYNPRQNILPTKITFDSGERVKTTVEGDSCVHLTVGETELPLDVPAARRVVTALQSALALIDAKDPQ